MSCMYLHILGSSVSIIDDGKDLGPITPTSSTFSYKDSVGNAYSICHTQVPLVPAFAFMDYKIQ